MCQLDSLSRCVSWCYYTYRSHLSQIFSIFVLLGKRLNGISFSMLWTRICIEEIKPKANLITKLLSTKNQNKTNTEHKTEKNDTLLI